MTTDDIELSDMDLVRQYAADKSESAFAAIVTRHVNLVYSAALRQVGDSHLAEEVTQTVFIVLARKAGSLSAKTILSGWLYRTARFAASAALKQNIRRQNREQEAHMQSILHDSADDASWEQLAPILDEAMAQLKGQDRDALVLRFFENKSLQEIGSALGVEERAAQKRVARSLEKLRAIFAKRGVALTAAIIAGTVSANSVQAAPIALATSISVTAVKGSAVAASTMTLVKGTLKIMTWIKLKMALGLAAAVLLVGGATTAVLSDDGARQIRPATTEEKAFAEKIVQAAKDQDYAAFIENGDKGFKQITEPMFKAVCVQMEKQFKGGHEVTYLGDLKAKGYQTTLWRISFKDGSDDALGNMAVKNGKVAGFIMQ